MHEKKTYDEKYWPFHQQINEMKIFWRDEIQVDAQVGLPHIRGQLYCSINKELVLFALCLYF